jgi:hypothetical protein
MNEASSCREFGRSDVRVSAAITVLQSPARSAVVGAAAAVALSLMLGGCSTSIADLPFGSTSDAPERPADVSAYPAVHNLPAPRDQAAMDPAEQAKIEKELIAARDKQAQASTAK